MRRFLFTLIFMGTVWLSPYGLHNAQADDMWDKGGRGLVDVVTSPYEIIRQGQMAFDKKGGLGIFTGSLRGVSSMVGRMGVGAYELVTFPLPGYDAILDPKYIIPSAHRAHADWGEDQISHVY